MRRVLVLLALSSIPSGFVLGADPENPFKKSEKGQWVSYRITIVASKQELTGKVTHKVKSKSDKSVTLEITSMLNGTEVPAKTQPIDLGKQYDLLSTANFPSGPDTRVEKKDSGKETIEIGGKKYDCEWTRYAVSIGAAPMKTNYDIKIWISKDVPLHGLVKMDIVSETVSVKMEIDKAGKD